MAVNIKIFYSTLLFVGVLGQHHEDKRCRCICPSPAEITKKNVSMDRKLFIVNVPPNKCNCIGVILPALSDELRQYEQQFCLRCDCIYQTRNTNVIMVVVVMVVWLITLLVVYMLFLICLGPFTTLKKRGKVYQETDGSEEARNLLHMHDEETED